MIFSTYLFTLAFLPAILLCYTLLLRRGQPRAARWALVLASLCFFAYGAGDFFPVFIVSVFFNYGLARALGTLRAQRREPSARALLVLVVVVNLALLGFYKYTDFVLLNINVFRETPLPLQHILLPVGISFYTFQIIGYTVDSWRGETRDYSLLSYLLFVTFFPHLIVGPIVHHKDIVPQYESLSTNTQTSENIALGVFLFAIGCSKKIVLADPLTGWAQAAFNNTSALSTLDAWGASLGYTLSYYFDLSGYADMAVGLGLLFGIHFPVNFNSPYKARNFAEYWNRWHITLSRFLGDYVFRSVFRKGAGSANFYWAVFVTFLVSGIWHGAGWTFVVWGVLNGLFVIASHMMKHNELALPLPVAWALTFVGAIAVRVLFVSRTFQDAWNVYVRSIDFASLSLSGNQFIGPKQGVYLLVGLGIVLLLPNSTEFRQRFRPSLTYGLATSVLLVMSFMNMSAVKGFLYFQF